MIAKFEKFKKSTAKSQNDYQQNQTANNPTKNISLISVELVMNFFNSQYEQKHQGNYKQTFRNGTYIVFILILIRLNKNQTTKEDEIKAIGGTDLDKSVISKQRN